MKRNSFTPILFIIIFLLGIWLGNLLSKRGSLVSSSRADKISYILNLIDKEYVDKVNKDTLSDKAIVGLLNELDPHSVYLTADVVKQENESLEGHFYGIGVQFRVSGDSIIVVRTIKGGPSDKVGILAGDRILKVNGKAFHNLTNDTVLHYLKGEKNSKVRLSVYRKGVKDLVDFVVTRDKIETKAVSFFGMLNKNTGYIKLSEFSATAHEEVAQALQSLKGKGMNQLIFDLRGNGGGYLSEAIKIADEFIGKGDLIVYTQGRRQGRSDNFATSGGLFEEGKLIVMIDELSASASEIVSGCIQDNDRGTIIGRRTFGKGLVQEQIPLPDKSAIRLTVARYYTPSGRCIQRPYISGDPDQYYEEFLERYANMEANADTLNHDPKLRYKTKKGRIVYGGGGIEPDINIPYSALKVSPSYSKLLKNGLIYKYCFDYVDANRKSFSQYSSGDDFLKRYNVDNNMFISMLNSAANSGVKKQYLTEKEKKEIKLLMKSYIAQNLYGDKYFHIIYNNIDVELQKALTYF